jgi:hypothetical protein
VTTRRRLIGRGEGAGGKLMAPSSLQVDGKSYGSRRGRGRGDWKPQNGRRCCGEERLLPVRG